MLWIVIFVALCGVPLGQGLPLRPTPEAYPHDVSEGSLVEWGSGSGLWAAVPALALLLTAVAVLLGCTWCYKHKNCKPNEGAENQLFTASATALHDGRRNQPPDTGFSEPVNNNISEDNNNGPISLREMQNIANNNATAYIVTENEDRNTRDSVVEFEPLPSDIRVVDPLERCADWFGGEDFPRNRLQYLREIGRGWFGRVVEGEIESNGTTTVAVKILNQNASLEDKARFLDEAKVYRDVTHENVLAFIAKCLQEDPWILMFELCSMDLQQYLIQNRPKMAILNESGVPLQLMCDVAAALSHLHSRGYLYGNVSSSGVLVRDADTPRPRGVLGSYGPAPPAHEFTAPETRMHPPHYSASSEVWSLGTLIWEVCAWGAPVPSRQPSPPDLPCPYTNHLYQLMQLCWNHTASSRPSAAQVHALLSHLRASLHASSADFEQRWQTLKPNTVPIVDEHIALVHAPSTSMASHFTGSDQDMSRTLSVDNPASRSSSIMSDRDPLSVHIKSESLTNLHGSLEDVRNIYLTHNEAAALDCHQGNIDLQEREQDRSDSSVDPWVKDLIAGSQDDVSYFRDVSDVIKNLDNILNSEKTSSSESSHQASPSRDNLSLDCKKDYPIQSSMVKSPGITNFKNILEMGFDVKHDDECDDDEHDRDTIETLSHSFERHSETTSQHTLENLTPMTPIKDFAIENEMPANQDVDVKSDTPAPRQHTELPKEYIDSSVINEQDLNVVSLPSVSENVKEVKEDCATPCDNLAEIVRTQVEPKSVDNIVNNLEKIEEKSLVSEIVEEKQIQNDVMETKKSREDKAGKPSFIEDKILPELVTDVAANIIENEVINPAIAIVSMVETKEQNKNEFDKNMHDDIVPPNLDLRKNELNKIDKPSDSSLSEIANALIEDIFAEALEKQEVASSRTEVEDIVKDSTLPELDNKSELPLIAAPEKSEDMSMTPEPVQINYRNECTEFVNNEIEKSEIPTLIDNLSEEESLAFSSNFTDMNLEIQIPESLPPVQVQNVNYENITEKAGMSMKTSNEITLPDLVQDISGEDVINNITSRKSPAKILLQSVCNEGEIKNEKFDDFEHLMSVDMQRSDRIATESNDSTAYMDLINYTCSQANNSEVPQDNVKELIKSCLNKSNNNETTCSLDKNDSTVYLDLPSVLKESKDFLNAEKFNCEDDNFCASTPKGSEASTVDNTLEASKGNEHSNENDTKVAEETVKSDQKVLADLLSPFDSPTKSHPTDTFDENSSVVLGPFENCSIEYNKGAKLDVDLPKEELLAFSSNFSEINLETPSPLRDGNFLNEVPDIANEDLQFEDITRSEDKKDETDNTDLTDQSATTKHVSPSTPPNSPGIYLASTSQQKYLVDIDLDLPETRSYPPIETDSGLSSLQKEIDLNQIELQITTKLAMAENENNLNIEYSGPLTVEGLVSEEDAILRESDAIPEALLAGNAGSIEDHSEGISLDEDCVNALRNELELKLPLAQVAGIEPACEPEWGELPPPPELIVHYSAGAGCALSPIEEETKHQLNQYENDAWNPLTATESSESYPEPCNDSTASVTDLPPHTQHSQLVQNTYSIHDSPSVNETYTLQKDIPTSRELTMSADSLNGSPYKQPSVQPQSAVDDRTYNKNDDEKISNCERLSQVSPFMMSPTTDTSAPESVDNATGVSTLSKTSVPTDAKHSKPSELSKATSIDSWCSNDTLYNVEENFDDLAMDADVPQFDNDKHELARSESTDTLHNEDEKEASHCSTYIVHDSKSEACDSFSPDSITANDNYTYTKVKTEVTGTTTSAVTKSDANDSTKSQTKDLAYGTLPSCSNCTTEMLSSLDPWKIQQPELVRKSPPDTEVTFTPPKIIEDKTFMLNDSPQTAVARINNIDSVDLTCLQDETSSHKSESTERQDLINIDFSQNYKRDMVPSITSTPITELVVDDDNVEAIPMNLPIDSASYDGQESLMNSITGFQTFVQSAEIKPQEINSLQDLGTQERNSDNFNGSDRNSTNTADYQVFEQSAEIRPREISPYESTSLLLEGIDGDSASLCASNSKKDSTHAANRTRTYSDFENFVATPEELNSTNRTTLASEKTSSYSDFQYSAANKLQEMNNQEVCIAKYKSPTYSDFETSAVNKPQERNSQDTSTVIDKSPNYTDFEHSAGNKPQETNSQDASLAKDKSPTYSDFETSAANKPQERNSQDTSTVIDKCPNYSDFEHSAGNKPQETNSQDASLAKDKSPTYSDFETSAANKPQERNSQDTSTVIDKSPNYSDFEHSAGNKPQETNSQIASLAKDKSPTYSDFETSAANKPQERNSQDTSTVIDKSPNDSDFKHSTGNKPQETNSQDASLAKDKSPTYSDFETSAANKPQERNSQDTSTVIDKCPNYSDFEHSAGNKPQETNSQDASLAKDKSPTYSDFEISAANKPQERNSQDKSPNYSDFERSAGNKPQETNSQDASLAKDKSPTYSDFETSAANKPQERNSQDKSPNYSDFVRSAGNKPQETNSQDASLAKDKSPTYSDFETSAANKPQEINSQDASVVIEKYPNYSDFEYSVANKPQEMNSQDTTLSKAKSPTYSDFENSAANKPQEIQSSSQHFECGMSSGSFGMFKESVQTRPQDLNFLGDANSLFLSSERCQSDIASSSNIEIPNDQTSISRMSKSIGNIEISPPNPANSVKFQYVMPDLNLSMYETHLSEEETDQPHSIIFTEMPHLPRTVNENKQPNELFEIKQNLSSDMKEIPNVSCNLYEELNTAVNRSNQSPESASPLQNNTEYDKVLKLNGITEAADKEDLSESKAEVSRSQINLSESNVLEDKKDVSNDSLIEKSKVANEIVCNGNSQNYAVVNFINETFEELETQSNDRKTKQPADLNRSEEVASEIETTQARKQEEVQNGTELENGRVNGVEEKIVAVTENFLENEKNFCRLDAYLPMLNDIRFTGPASEIMSTSFNQESPSEANSPECEQDGKSDAVAEIIKDWDSDTESRSSNSSSGEFIWKDGEGHETPLVPTTHFDHQQDGGGTAPRPSGKEAEGAGSEMSGDSGSGSEGDEVEFVPSSWDCLAAPGKSSLRSLEQQPNDNKKRVVFKRQKYHCVYEYPRELADVETSPYLPDLSTYCEWDLTSAEEAELGYGQLYGTPMDMFQLRSSIAFGTEYDDDFFISSSARPFESLGIMSTSSQFFPGMHVKAPPPPAPPADLPLPLPSPTVTAITNTRAPSLDFTTPDSGVEDITPLSTTDEDFKKKLDTEVSHVWKPIDSASSSESVSPSSPGGEALGGLRHTRDKLKLDLPPSPHIPSPRHNRVFNFVLDKPKRHRVPDERPSEGTTPLVMTDDTPIITSSIPIQKETEDVAVPEPTFSTFGKNHSPKNSDSESPEQKIVLTDDVEESEASPTTESKEEDPVKNETVKGEGTVLDSGDEDSGIESSSKATLERKTNVS